MAEAVKKTTVKKKIAPKAVSNTEEKTTKAPKKINLVAEVLDIKGAKAGTLDLPEEIFGVKVNKPLMAQAVRVYLANQRAGSASTKTRGEVAFSTRKIYKQKGTGRARHGGVGAPLFVHGGVAHGPKPQDYSLDMPKKMRRNALFSALSAKYKENKVVFVKGLEAIEPKTKNMVTFAKAIAPDDKKNILVVIPNISETSVSVVKALRNIQGISYMFANQLNTYEVLKTRKLIIMKDALDTIQKTFNGSAK